MKTQPDSASAAPSVESLRQQAKQAGLNIVLSSPLQHFGNCGHWYPNRPCDCPVGEFIRSLYAFLDHERSLVAEIQRLKAINSELCSEHNGLLADGARWQRRAEEAEAEIQRLTDALDAENDIIVALTEQLNLLRDDK